MAFITNLNPTMVVVRPYFRIYATGMYANDNLQKLHTYMLQRYIWLGVEDVVKLTETDLIAAQACMHQWFPTNSTIDRSADCKCTH